MRAAATLLLILAVIAFGGAGALIGLMAAKLVR